MTTPTRPRQLTYMERTARFPLEFSIDVGSEIKQVKVPAAWETHNLVRLGPYHGGKLMQFSPRVHILAAPVFTALFKTVEQAGAMDDILTCDGAFYARLKRGVEVPAAGSPKSAYEKLLSNHSRGTAIDFNAKWNPMGAPYDAKKHEGKGDLARIIAIADSIRVPQDDGSVWGIAAGAHWQGKYTDPQHFELGVWDK